MTERTKNIKAQILHMRYEILTGKMFSNLILVKYRWYLLFLFGLALTYMSMHYYMERTVKEVEQQSIVLKKLQEDYTLRLWSLEALNKRSIVIKQIESRLIDLKEPTVPAKRIKID